MAVHNVMGRELLHTEMIMYVPARQRHSPSAFTDIDQRRCCLLKPHSLAVSSIISIAVPARSIDIDFDGHECNWEWR